MILEAVCGITLYIRHIDVALIHSNSYIYIHTRRDVFETEVILKGSTLHQMIM